MNETNDSAAGKEEQLISRPYCQKTFSFTVTYSSYAEKKEKKRNHISLCAILQL